eukprot:508403-Rhodomonas_salina.1
MSLHSASCRSTQGREVGGEIVALDEAGASGVGNLKTTKQLLESNTQPQKPDLTAMIKGGLLKTTRQHMASRLLDSDDDETP